MRQRLRLIVSQAAAVDDVFNRSKRFLRAFLFDVPTGFIAETGDIAKTETKT